MLVKLGDNYVVSGSWFSGSYAWGPPYLEINHNNLRDLISNSGSGVYTVFDIEVVEDVNENSYPDLYADGARKRVSNTTELETTGSYLVSHTETLILSGSDPTGKIGKGGIINSDNAKNSGFTLVSSGSHQEWQVIIDNN